MAYTDIFTESPQGQFINNNEPIRNMTPKEISDAQDKLLAEIRETQEKLDSIR